MKTADLDVVYFVKESPKNEELRYSLRSVEKNLPHRNVWIYGGCPDGIIPDCWAKCQQGGRNKWDRVRGMYKAMCLNDEISENFILFNDDFFVMQPVTSLTPYYRCSLYEHIVRTEMKYGDTPTTYTKLLRSCVRKLEDVGKGCLSYELHTPMMMNRVKLLRLLELFPDAHCMRSFYGNYYDIGGQQRGDVKIFNLEQDYDKDEVFLSTDDSIIPTHPVWDFICSSFKGKSRFEK